MLSSLFLTLLALAVLFVRVRYIKEQQMAKRVRRGPFQPSIYNIFSQSIWETGPELDVHGPGWCVYVGFFERLEVRPFGEVGPNQFGVLIARYGPPSTDVFAPLLPLEAIQSMRKTLSWKFEAGLQARYIVGQWKGIYDWMQYLLVTPSNIDDLKQTADGKSLIPHWLTKEMLLFPENKSGKQLLLSCRGKLRRAIAWNAKVDPRKLNQYADLPEFKEVQRVIRPGGFVEILRYGMTVLAQKSRRPAGSPAKKYATLEELQSELASDSEVCKAMLDKLLSSNNNLHDNYTNIDKFVDCFGGEVPAADLLYGVDQTGYHAIPGHIFKIVEADLVHSGAGQVLTVDALFGIISAIERFDPTGNVNPSSLSLEDRVEHYHRLFSKAHLVPPGFVGIWVSTVPTGTTWAVRPDPFRFESGKIGERCYFLGQSPADYGERQVDMHLGEISMADADGNKVSLDIDLRTQARPRLWPRLRFVFGYIDESVNPQTARNIKSWTEYNLVNMLIAPVLNGVIAEIIGGSRTAYFYGEGKDNKDSLTAFVEIAQATNKAINAALGFLGMMFIAVVKKRTGPEEFEKTRANRAQAEQAVVTAQMILRRNRIEAQALVVKADGEAKAKALQELRHLQALVSGLGKEGGILAAALEKAKIPTVAVQGGAAGVDASSAAAVAVGIVNEISSQLKELAASVPNPPPFEQSFEPSPMEKAEGGSGDN